MAMGVHELTSLGNMFAILEQAPKIVSDAPSLWSGLEKEESEAEVAVEE
jgi:hypothetical protein